jgi:hypothetical protein
MPGIKRDRRNRSQVRLHHTEVQPSENGAQENVCSNTAPKQHKIPGRPFVKGIDPRRNLKGRPRTFDETRTLAQSIAHETLTLSSGKRMTIAEAILRQWAASDEPQLQKAFIEYAFGKVPDQLETTPLEPKTTLILHYGHEKEKRDRDHQRLSAQISPGADQDR